MVLRLGRSLGIARHWHPVRVRYGMPSSTWRMFTDRVRPSHRSGGIIGAINPHCSSVKSDGYGSVPSSSYDDRLYLVLKQALSKHKLIRN
jgi:hypothetical protein